MGERAQDHASQNGAASFAPVSSGLLQRKCGCGTHTIGGAGCRQCKNEENPLQRKASSFADVSEVPPIVHEVLRSPGQPLDSTTRAFMEPRFGHDFSQVRVHTGTTAEQSALQVNANAYTVGSSIVFGAGQFAPKTPAGQSLIAHELAHVVQQTRNAGAPTTLARQPAKGGAGPVKAGFETDVISESISYPTKYGKLELTATAKIAPTIIGAGSSPEPVGSSTTYTSKDKPTGRTSGVKQEFSYRELKDIAPLKGLKLTDLSVGVEGELSGSEITAAATFKFTIVASTFSAPATAKAILIKAKEGEGIKIGGVEFKIAPFSYKIKIGSMDAKVLVEYKATFMADLKKVGIEIVEKIAEKELKKAAEKQGLKMLGRTAGETVLKRIGPIAAAFGVGWDIGTLLNKYTVASEVARDVQEAILGDFYKQYHEAGTLGKMVLLSKNSPRIIAALVASGVAGAVAGIGDLVLFKLMGLDRLPDYYKALVTFKHYLEAMPKPGDALGDLMLANAITWGIKFNPKYFQISDPSLLTLAKLVFAAIHPLYKQKNGYQKLVDLKLYDFDFPETDLARIAASVLKNKWNYEGLFDLNSPPAEVARDFLELDLRQFLGLMESNRIITYKVEISKGLGQDAIDQKLMEEVFL
ncbi:MAG: DUF4157 domain-containing protein [Acidobacteriota bacterium]